MLPITQDSEPIRLRHGGTDRWYFADGTVVPVVAGADFGEELAPSNLASLSTEQLVALESRIAQRIGRIAADEDAAIEVAELQAGLDSIDEERTRRDDEGRLTAAVAERVDAALAPVIERLTQLAPAAVAEPEAEEATEPEAPAAEAEAPAPEASAEGGDDDDGDDDDGDEAGDPEAATDPSPAELADQTNEPAGAQGGATTRPRGTVSFAATYGDRRMGESVDDVDAIAALMHEVAVDLPDARGHWRDARRRIASVNFETPDEFTADAMENQETLNRVLGRFDTAEALVAAGGWCAPSEIRYDFFSLETVSGLLDLPEVGVRRGGLSYPVSPYLEDAIMDEANGPWLWTEDDDESATDGSPTKPELRIPCVTFQETRLDAHGVALRHGNLSDRAYPELTRRYIRMALVGHEHKVNKRFLDAMVTGSTAVTLDDNLPESSATVAYLQGLNVRAAAYRDKYYMAEDDIIEVVTPRWFLRAAQDDMMKRGGVVEMDTMRSDIVRWLSARAIRVQFVSDFQQLVGTEEHYPNSVRSLLYAPGTWVRGNGGRLDLGVTRDSTLNATNDFTALWTEEFKSLMKFGHESQIISTPVRVSGAVFCCDDEGS